MHSVLHGNHTLHTMMGKSHTTVDFVIQAGRAAFPGGEQEPCADRVCEDIAGDRRQPI